MLNDPNYEKEYLLPILYEGDERDDKRPAAQAAMDVQKRKFLAALRKTKLTLTEEEKLAEEAIQLYVLSPHPYWSDTYGTEKVKIMINRNQYFDITLYLNCAKLIFLAYSGDIPKSRDIIEAYIYVLTHARSFGDTAKNIFQFEGEGDTSFTKKFDERVISKTLSDDSVYMKKITDLIERLRVSYDESKYRILNVNVTYLTLLMLRRAAKYENPFKDTFNKPEIHGDYVKLCPHPLHHRLPKVSYEFIFDVDTTEFPVFLAIHAFLTATDALTKKILQVTCIQYMEWIGLQLPALFFRVVQLYAIDEGQLWDSLRRVRGTEGSLYRLSRDYYEQFERSLAEPPETAIWFPYCRVLQWLYHNNLCARSNQNTCLILAYFVDLKLGFGKSFARKAYWTKKISKMEKENLLQIVEQLLKKYPFA